MLRSDIVKLWVNDELDIVSTWNDGVDTQFVQVFEHDGEILLFRIFAGTNPQDNTKSWALNGRMVWELRKLRTEVFVEMVVGNEDDAPKPINLLTKEDFLALYDGDEGDWMNNVFRRVNWLTVRKNRGRGENAEVWKNSRKKVRRT